MPYRKSAGQQSRRTATLARLCQIACNLRGEHRATLSKAAVPAGAQGRQAEETSLFKNTETFGNTQEFRCAPKEVGLGEPARRLFGGRVPRGRLVALSKETVQPPAGLAARRRIIVEFCPSINGKQGHASCRRLRFPR